MKFNEYLDNFNLNFMLKELEFYPPVFTNEGKIFSILSTALEEQKRILISGDYDVDGCLSALCAYDVLKYIGFKQVDLYNYLERTHDIPNTLVIDSVKNKYDVVIILDTGSSDLVSLNRLKAYGIEVIVIDHHKTKYSYNDFSEVALVNSTLEDTKYSLSAGALTFCVMHNLCLSFGKSPLWFTSAYALITLYSDCMQMDNHLNISIYNLASKLSLSQIPSRIRLLMRSYDKLSRRAIEYTISPVINACFRASMFNLLNSFFFDYSKNSLELNDIKELMLEVHQSSKKTIDILCDYIISVGVTILDNFVVVDLNQFRTVDRFKEFALREYTGLIANNLTSHYKKTAIVLCSEVGNKCKGSLRDYLNRDFLTVFSQICQAGGHPPAFGFFLNSFEVAQFIENIKIIDKHIVFNQLGNLPIVLSNPSSKLDIDQVKLIATYNEFSGIPSAPFVFIKSKIPSDIKSYYSQFGYSYKWDGINVDSNVNIKLYSVALLKPIVSNVIKLKVEAV